MKTIIGILLLICSIAMINCSAQQQWTFTPKEVYHVKDLTITQITENTFVHTSFLATHDFGNVPCNGLIVSDHGEVVIFDTPTNNEVAEVLIKWIQQQLNCRIKAVVATHFHDDCLGGLKAFDDHQIPSYAYFKTTALAKENNLVVPKNSFKQQLLLKVGQAAVMAKFFGEGHTRDNVVAYFPKENVMFGGCLIKELNANKGNLADANVADWSNTVEKVKKAYPRVKVVVPGHGVYGDKALLDYTIKLFSTPQ